MFLARMLLIYLGVIFLVGLLLFSVVLFTLAGSKDSTQPNPHQTDLPNATQVLRGDRWIFALAGALSLTVIVSGAILLARESTRIQYQRIRSDFFDRLSHEFKTPVTMIRLFAETLAGERELSRGSQQKYARMIVVQTSHLENMIDRVLNYALIASRKRKYSFRSDGFEETVRTTVEACSEHLRLAGFEVDTRLQEDLPSYVRHDPEALSQAILNLIDNARKYSGTRKEILIRASRRNDRISVEVSNHGPGLPETELERIWEPFYRGSNVPEGTAGQGLGLFLTAEIIRAHQGWVDVESLPGNLTRFRLNLPIDRTLSRPPKPVQHHPNNRRISAGSTIS